MMTGVCKVGMSGELEDCWAVLAFLRFMVIKSVSMVLFFSSHIQILSCRWVVDLELGFNRLEFCQTSMKEAN